ncbi:MULTISPECIES: hypothetical protein [Bifidobacterium]|uniref:Uncharacterized protein n=1 Tax=Bifidobacterium apousia TaxID=2750996 RepID=A0A556R1S2_9BIFI|nr:MULTISPECIES: hypothetical protein [Bifidobacterium]MBI0136841.1 hypothetical protein [Bifidobacterium sp. W8120]TSJ82848.1 hypothetical protein FPK30_06990 [Bifidobacterium apousia]
MRESDKIRLQGHVQSQKSAREPMQETSEINGLYVDRYLLMQQAVPAGQRQEEDSAILLTTVHEQLPLQRGQGRPKPVRRQVKDDPPARKTNIERRAETLNPSPLTRTVIA